MGELKSSRGEVGEKLLHFVKVFTFVLFISALCAFLFLVLFISL